MSEQEVARRARSGNTESSGDEPGIDRPSRTADQTWSRILVVVIGGALVAGIVLRFVPRSGLWLDEALSVNIASLPLGEIPGALRHDGHPPLYYVLLHFWMSALGDSDWAVRAMSGLISTLTIPATYVAARRLARRRGAQLGDPRRVGWLAVAVVAVMPYAVRYGAETRMYALVMLLVTLGYPIVDDLLGDPADGDRPARGHVRSILPAALVTAALLWTHYWTIWLLGAVGAITVGTIWARRNRLDRVALRGPIHLLVAMAVGGLAFLPWLPTMAYQAAHTGTPWGERFGPFSMAVITLVDFSGGRFGAAQFLSYILVVLMVGAALVSVRHGRTAGAGPTDPSPDLVVDPRITPRIRIELLVVILTMSLGWVTARLSGNTYSSRYGAVVFPLFILAITAGLALARRQRTTVMATTAIALLCVYGSVGSARADRTQVGQLVDAIVADMSTHRSTGDVRVVACPDQLGVATQRQIDQRPSLLSATGDVTTFPTSRDPHFVDWVDYADRNAAASPTEFVRDLNASLSADATIYLINSPHYRTLEGKCEAVIDGLATGRHPEVLEPIDTSGLDEAAQLRVFRPGPGETG